MFFFAAAASAGVLVELKDGETLKLERHEVEMRIDGVLDENIWD